MKQKRFSDVLGLRLSRQALRVSERPRHLRPFVGKPGTPAPGETLCGARVGVGRRGRRTWAIRHFHPRGRPADRVSASGGGDRSERLTCRRGGAGAGASRDAAHGTHLRIADYSASTRHDQRWQATATGDKSSVSRNSWSLGSGFVREGQGQSWHGSPDVLFARRGGSQDTEAVSPGGTRDYLRRFIATAVSIATLSGRRRRKRNRFAPQNVSQPDMAERKE